MIIITGAGGFIGSNMVAEATQAGLGPIVACDYWGNNDKWRNVAKHFITEFVSPDHLLPFIRLAGSSVNAVVHMGAISATTEKDVDKLISENIQLTVNLWELCTEFKIPFLYASSAATYGSLESGLIDDQSPESLSRLRPLNGYGWSKHATDCILMNRVNQGKPTPPQWCGLKFFNVYGPNEYHKGDMQSVIAKFFPDVFECKPIRLFQSHRKGINHGAQSRDFVYVKDCTAVMCWLLQNPSVSGLFNIGTGQANSFRDVISAIAAALQVPVNFDFVPMPAPLRDRYQYFTKAEMAKLRNAGYRPKFHTIQEGISNYVLQYLNTDDMHR